MTGEEEDELDRVERIFLEAKDLETKEQPAFVERACDGNAALRDEVGRYLAAHRLASASDTDAAAKRLHDRISQALGAAPRPDPFVGARLGKYLITQKIAEGGMGAVYEARQDRPARRVALKLIPPQRLHDDVARQRFQFEADTLARLDHPAIAKVYEAGAEEVAAIGQIVPFFAMEFVAGAEPLSSHCERRRLPHTDRLRLLVAVCDAVHHAHQKGILHRDLKPSNILVDEIGRPKVIDFGIARALGAEAVSLTRPGLTPGTLEFMAPEQWESGSQTADVQSDVYALGVVAFLTLAGELPFEIPEGATDTARFAIVRGSEPRRLRGIDRSWHKDVDAILAMALARDPRDRYPSAAKLADDIQKHLNHEPTDARPPKLVGLATRFVMRKPWQSLTAVAAAVILAVTMVVFQITASNKELEKANSRLDSEKYLTAMMTADMASRDRDFARASQVLDGAGKAARKGWEHDHLADRAHASKGVVRGFDHPVAQILVSPNGTDVVVAEETELPLVYLMKLGDFVSGERVAPEPVDLMKKVPGTLSPSSRIALCDGGELLCCSVSLGGGAEGVPGKGVMVVFDVATRTRRRDWLLPEVRALAGHPAQPIVASGAADGKVRLWSALSGEQVAETRPEWKSPVHGVQCLAWNPDGHRLAASTEGREIAVFDTTDLAKPVATQRFPCHHLHIEALAWSPDGCLLASASSDQTIKIWDVGESTAGTPAGVATLVGHTGGVLAVGFVPHYGVEEGRYALASGSADETVRFWDLQTRRGYVFHPGENGIARPENTPSRGHEEAVRCIAVSPDGTTILSGSEDGTVRAWSAAAVETVFELKGHLTSVPSVAFDREGSRIVSADPGGVIFIWDAATGLGCRSDLRRFHVAEMAEGNAALHPERPIFATATKNGRIGLFDVRIAAQPRLVRLLGEPDWTAARRTAVAFTADGATLWAATCDRASWWRLDKSDPTNVAETGTIDLALAGPVSLAISPDGSRIALGGSDAGGFASLQLVDRRNGALKPRRGSPGTIQSLAFSPDGGRLAVTGDFGPDPRTVHLWNPADDHDAKLEGHMARAAAVAWSPDGKRIATSSEDRTIRLWDPTDGIETGVLRGNVSVPRALTFSPDGKTLASALSGVRGTENVVKLWETEAHAKDKREVRAHLKECAGLFDRAVLPIGKSILETEDRIGTMPMSDVESRLKNAEARYGSETLGRILEVWARRRALSAWKTIAAPPECAPDTRGASALEMMKGALAVAGDDPLVLRTLGAAECRAGRFDEAVKHLRACDDALRKALPRSDYADAAFLAIAYARGGRLSEAAHWAETLEAVMPPPGSADFAEASALEAEIRGLLAARPTTR